MKKSVIAFALLTAVVSNGTADQKVDQKRDRTVTGDVIKAARALSSSQLDAARAVLWNQALARAGILHQRVSGARSRWCIELWRYYDFALAKTASPTDGHALMVADIRKHIDSTFASQRRPIKEALTTLNFGKDTV